MMGRIEMGTVRMRVAPSEGFVMYGPGIDCEHKAKDFLLDNQSGRKLLFLVPCGMDGQFCFTNKKRGRAARQDLSRR